MNQCQFPWGDDHLSTTISITSINGISSYTLEQGKFTKVSWTPWDSTHRIPPHIQKLGQQAFETKRRKLEQAENKFKIGQDSTGQDTPLASPSNSKGVTKGVGVDNDETTAQPTKEHPRIQRLLSSSSASTSTATSGTGDEPSESEASADAEVEQIVETLTQQATQELSLTQQGPPGVGYPDFEAITPDPDLFQVGRLSPSEMINRLERMITPPLIMRPENDTGTNQQDKILNNNLMDERDRVNQPAVITLSNEQD